MFIVIAVYLIETIFVTESCCPRQLNNFHCRCRQSASSLDVTCNIYNLTQLYDLPTSTISQYTITTLKIRLHQIESLPSSILQYSHLTSLTVAGHDLVSIHEDAFLGLENKLTYLCFENSGLQRVPIASIRRICSLKTLILDTNKISSLDISLRRIPLYNLYAPSNQISTIGRRILPATLRTLDLVNNSLLSLNFSLRCGVTKLRKLYVSNNKISSLSGEFDGTPKLTQLVAKRNYIGSIENGSLAKLPELQLLYLSNNRIYQIINGLKGLRRLQQVDLSYNGLTYLDVMAFSDLTALEVLILGFNNLTYLPRGLLNCLNSLEILDISHNNLYEIDFLVLPRAFWNLGNASDGVTDIILGEEMEVCNFTDYSSLRSIRMRGNRLVCNDAVNQTVRYFESNSVSLTGNPC